MLGSRCCCLLVSSFELDWCEHAKRCVPSLAVVPGITASFIDGNREVHGLPEFHVGLRSGARGRIDPVEMLTGLWCLPRDCARQWHRELAIPETDNRTPALVKCLLAHVVEAPRPKLVVRGQSGYKAARWSVFVPDMAPKITPRLPCNAGQAGKNRYKLPMRMVDCNGIVFGFEVRHL